MASAIQKKKPQQNIRFAKSITLKSGRKLYAEDYGYVAFPMRVRTGSPRRTGKTRR